MPNEPVKITAQELEKIKKLPSCQFMLGGTPQTGFFDKVNEKIYYLDSEGNWMVKRGSRRENRKSPRKRRLRQKRTVRKRKVGKGGGCAGRPNPMLRMNLRTVGAGWTP